ncbi:T9SS sorting signal type C domain-containing protein [Flavobacterium ponti]|uniref:T9SS sorting signal type C domain-containing protein n=1 Tax=Flavobacterium ponti TaxID=665133 RepID=A0ABV9P1Q8_9FLAO
MKLQLLKTVLIFLFVFACTGVINGQVTHTFAGTSGTIDSNISYTTEKNTSSNAPLFSSELRLYYSNASPYNGCSITLLPSNGVIINSVEIYAISSTYTPTLRYTIGSASITASNPAMSLSGTTYSLSGLNVSTSLKIRNANTTNTQARLSGIKVTYTLPGPTVISTASTLIGTDSANLNGSINANGLNTDATFEYGTTTSYGSTVSATPSSVTGTTATSISASINSLSLNTQYHYRAVGTVSGTPTNGSDMTFYTLAATPGVLTLSNPLQTTLDVTLNATTENSNPAITEYAIQETGGQYVQANGTLGASEVWQTAATWATTTITGLSTSTLYTFQAKARNGANVETVFGTSASETTLAAQLVDYAVVQFPNTTQSILEGTNLTVYARAYEPGLTTLSGEQSNLLAWIGYSSTDVDPSNPVFTWIPATFNAEFGNDDEYQATLTGLPIGTYYYAVRFQIGTGPYVYGGSNGNWNNDNVTLNVNADVVDFANVQFPTTATITEGNAVTVYAQVYEPGVTEAAGQGAGITAEIGYSSTDSTPDATWTWTSATFNVQSNNNDEYQATIGSNLAPGTYYYASRFLKSGSSTYIYGGTTGIWSSGNSGVLTVNVLGNPNATAASDITPSSFTANWEAVTDATSYRLDVSVSSNFEITNTTSIVESFETGLSGGYQTATVSLSTGDWQVENVLAGTTGVNSGSKSAQLQSATGSQLISPSFDNGISSINFWVTSSTSSGAIQVNYSIDGGMNWIPTSNSPYTGLNTSKVQISVDINTNSPTLIQIKRTGATIYIDDIQINSNTVVPNFVSGYEDLNVGNVTSYNVTGLTQGTTYYYRVRAVGQTTSDNSNVIDVTTGYSSVTWDGTSWTNTVGPDSTMDAIIEGVYSTSTNGAFNAKTVTLNSGSLTINSDTTIEIQDELVNNLTSAAVVIENNAILRQFNNVANTGQITVRRNSANALRLDYTAWSSPVSGQNALAFSPATLPNRFYDYDASSNAYVSIVPSTTDFTAGKGILIRTPNNWSSTTPAAYPGEFKGVPNNGDVTTTVVDGFNLLGNPYTSPISATSFLLNTNNSSTLGMNTIHFWTHTIASNPVTGTYATSNYATHNGAGGVASAAGGEEPDGIIQVGQGFVIEVDVNGTAEFNNSMRLSASNGQFFKSANQTTTLEKHRMWLDLTSPQYSHNQILVGYIEGATNTIDSSLDAKLFGQSNSVIYSTINNSKYVIQSRALPFTASDIVPLGLIAQTAGQYTISMNHVDGLFDTQDIYLRDNLLNITHDIKGSPYTFVSDAGQFDSRFEIVYAAPLATELPNFNENSVVVYTNEAGITINAGQTIIDNVKVYDVRGRLLFSQLNVNANSLVLDKINTTNQVLILQIGSVDNKVISKKIVN